MRNSERWITGCCKVCSWHAIGSLPGIDQQRQLKPQGDEGDGLQDNGEKRESMSHSAVWSTDCNCLQNGKETLLLKFGRKGPFVTIANTEFLFISK